MKKKKNKKKKTGNLTPEEQNIDRKRSRSEHSSYAFTIHCVDDDKELK